MSLISFTPVTDGSTASASGVNTPLSTIYNDYNGGITDANIASGAAIAASKISMASLANPYKFLVYKAAAQTLGTGATKVLYDTKTFDTGSNFDAATNHRFTAPVAGFYFFKAQSSCATPSTATNYQLLLYKNGSLILTGDQTNVANNAAASISVSGLLQLSATDYIEVFAATSTHSLATTGGAAYDFFSGFFVSAT